MFQSIFGSDVEDLRSTGNANQWKPLDVRMSLKPLAGSAGSDVYVSTKLRITCSKKYPNV